jgi:hypothetical protein
LLWSMSLLRLGNDCLCRHERRCPHRFCLGRLPLGRSVRGHRVSTIHRMAAFSHRAVVHRRLELSRRPASVCPRRFLSAVAVLFGAISIPDWMSGGMQSLFSTLDSGPMWFLSAMGLPQGMAFLGTAVAHSPYP